MAIPTEPGRFSNWSGGRYSVRLVSVRPYIEKPYNFRLFKHYLATLVENYARNSARMSAWLAAEVSNPNCSWHKEPYPQEILAANQRQNVREIASAIRLANQYSNIVVAVAVGNEATVDWTDHFVPVERMIEHVRRAARAARIAVEENIPRQRAERLAEVVAAIQRAIHHRQPAERGVAPERLRGGSQGESHGRRHPA